MGCVSGHALCIDSPQPLGEFVSGDGNGSRARLLCVVSCGHLRSGTFRPEVWRDLLWLTGFSWKCPAPKDESKPEPPCLCQRYQEQKLVSRDAAWEAGDTRKQVGRNFLTIETKEFGIWRSCSQTVRRILLLWHCDCFLTGVRPLRAFGFYA